MLAAAKIYDIGNLHLLKYFTILTGKKEKIEQLLALWSPTSHIQPPSLHPHCLHALISCHTLEHNISHFLVALYISQLYIHLFNQPGAV
jgi:hypothetical protein